MVASYRLWVWGLALAGCLAGGVGEARGQGASRFSLRGSPKVLAAFRQVVARPSDSTVRVKCDGKDAALGTVVRADGWILTKATELKGKVTCQLKDGRLLDAKIVGVEDKHDLALLKVEATGLTPITWRESKSAVVGSWLATPGLGADPVAVGVVSVATRKPAMRDMPPVARATAGGYLGIGLADEEVAKVGEVMPRTAAAKAGLKVGDVVLTIGGKKVPDPETLVDMVGRHKPGETITLKVKRGDKELELKATLGKRPGGGRMSRGEMQNRMGGPLSERR